MRVLYEKEKKELEKSIRLRDLSHDGKLSYEKQREICKEQDEAYKKFNFVKCLRKALSEVK